MADTRVTRSVIKTIKTTATLTRKEYEPILRAAVGAPADAVVDIEDAYGGDITITWTEVTYDDGATDDNEGNSD